MKMVSIYHLKPIVLSDVCNLNKYENLYITEMMFIQYKYLSHAVEMVCDALHRIILEKWFPLQGE